jgi:NACHT domain
VTPKGLTAFARPSWVLEPPSGPGPALPVITRHQLLPFSHLTWPDFERLCLRLATLEGNPEHWQLYGTAGQAQGGIDIFVRRAAPDGYAVWQSKRHRSFSAAKVRQAVETFLAGVWAARCSRFILCTSASLTDAKIADEIEQQAARLRTLGIAFVPYDDAKLSEFLKTQPALVDDFFGRAWVTAFCGPEVAEALGPRLDGPAFSQLRKKLGALYMSHFAAVDPGVIRAAAANAVAGQSALPLSARFIAPDLLSATDQGSEGWATRPGRVERRQPNPETGLTLPETREDPTSGISRRRDRRVVALEAWTRDLQRSILVGPPGAGKSTLLRFIALDMLAEAPRLTPLRERFPGLLPVWISFPLWTRQIKRLAPGSQVSLPGIVKAWLEAQGEPHLVAPLLRAIEEDRALLLVDGIDEWVDEVSAATAIGLLQTFLGARDLPVVVASRPHGARLLASLDGSWAQYELAPFTIGQQVDFVAAWLQHLLPSAADPTTTPAMARERAKSLIDEIHRAPQIVPLAEVPLLLAGLLALSLAGSSLPRSRYRAYRELCSRMLESHPLSRGKAALATDQQDDLDPTTRETVLANLCL